VTSYQPPCSEAVDFDVPCFGVPSQTVMAHLHSACPCATERHLRSALGDTRKPRSGTWDLANGPTGDRLRARPQSSQVPVAGASEFELNSPVITASFSNLTYSSSLSDKCLLSGHADSTGFGHMRARTAGSPLPQWWSAGSAGQHALLTKAVACGTRRAPRVNRARVWCPFHPSCSWSPHTIHYCTAKNPRWVFEALHRPPARRRTAFDPAVPQRGVGQSGSEAETK
jgi:hypothetical protein